MNTPECTHSTSGDHNYDLRAYERDDQGFYIPCIHCNKIKFFAANSLEELYDMFGLNDDE